MVRSNDEHEDISEDDYDVDEYIYELMEEVILGQDQKAKSKLQSEEKQSRICFGGGCGGLLIPDTVPTMPPTIPTNFIGPVPKPNPIGSGPVLEPGGLPPVLGPEGLPPALGPGGLPPIQDGGPITVDDLLYDGSDPNACDEDWNEIMNNIDLEEENEENAEFDMLNSLLEEKYNAGVTLIAHGLTVFFILIFTLHLY